MTQPRPLYFFLPVWGQRYCEYLVDRLLPCLLAPSNLPLLRAEDGHRLLIATTREDWQSIETLPIMHHIRRYAAPTWIAVDAPESADDAFAQYTVNIRHMGVCLRKLVEAVHADQAYGCSLLPDVIVSDGMVASLLSYARSGHQLVLCSSLRQVQEDVFSDLARRGLWTESTRLSQTCEPLTVPPRLAAELAVRHLHPELSRFEEDAPDRPFLPPFRYCRTPSQQGFVLHTFYAVPVLMDYSVVAADHTECLAREAFENVYIGAAFSRTAAIHFVQDINEFSMLSLAPRDINWSPPASVATPRGHPWVHRYTQLLSIRRSLATYTKQGTDVIKLNLFRVGFRWHAGDPDDAWIAHERRLDRLFNVAIGDYYRSDLGLRFFLFDVPSTLLPAARFFLHKIRQIAGKRRTA
jgi:hypothetical protein